MALRIGTVQWSLRVLFSSIYSSKTAVNYSHDSDVCNVELRSGSALEVSSPHSRAESQGLSVSIEVE